MKQRLYGTGLLNNKSRNFWSEIKHIRSHSAGSSKTVDGISDSSSISKLFADKYCELYTCVACLTMRVVCSILYRTLIIWSQRRIAQAVLFFVFVISELLGNLKLHKKDGRIDLSSDHIVNACEELFVHITLLFNAILVHGAVCTAR